MYAEKFLVRMKINLVCMVVVMHCLNSELTWVGEYLKQLALLMEMDVEIVSCHF